MKIFLVLWILENVHREQKRYKHPTHDKEHLIRTTPIK